MADIAYRYGGLFPKQQASQAAVANIKDPITGTRCPKCGGVMQGPKYCRGKMGKQIALIADPFHGNLQPCENFGEHLYSFCLTCGYEMGKPCLDAGGKAVL